MNDSDRLSITIFVIVLVWIATFALCYGPTALRAALFPLLFLLLMIPPPAIFLEQAVSLLQRGSAEVSYFLFRLTGSPISRDGLRFSLPGVDIEIAEECSGIRSSLSLCITGLIASHLFLESTWKKAAFVLWTIPVAIFKNAVRIVAISMLGIHVDTDFFHGNLHRRGGAVFALVGLSVLALSLVLLRLTDHRAVLRRLPATRVDGTTDQVPEDHA